MEMIELEIELPSEMVAELREHAAKCDLELESMLSLWLARVYHTTKEIRKQ